MNDILNQNNQIISVGELNRSAKYLLEKSYSNIKVEGEISNLSIPSSGHMYFTLKDSDAAIRCAMFKNANMRLNFSPKNGDKCIVTGNVSLYAPRGDFQLIASSMEPSGTGNLMLKFEQLKNKLAEEGLFDETKKLEIPSIPKHIAIITSGSTAAWQDVLTSIKRRAPSMKISLSEAVVQGDAASTTIINALDRIHKYNDASKTSLVDLILIVRGGGSIEDLWCFNDEFLAREISKTGIPIISGVGHEIDFTICDFVSDLRAPTPTAAAEIASNGYYNLNEKLQTFKNDLFDNISSLITNKKHIVNTKKAELKNPLTNLKEKIQKIDNIDLRLLQAQKNFLKEKALILNNLSSLLNELNPKKNIKELHLMLLNIKSKIELHTLSKLKFSKSYLTKLESNIKALDPLSILERGYSIVETEDGKIVKNSSQIKANQKLSTRFATGSASVKVIDKS
ncbi:MAG: exodeoxyribonuclease VII large subunit [Gammaproteobacteria bacterium]